MRKWVGVVALFAVVAVIGISVAQARTPDMSWNGWIVDSSCSAKEAMWSNKACIIKCVKEKGASYVFVVSKDKKVVKIENQDAVKEDDLGMEVKVMGNLKDDGSLHISKVEMAK
jgi:hypothetical protein